MSGCAKRPVRDGTGGDGTGGDGIGGDGIGGDGTGGDGGSMWVNAATSGRSVADTYGAKQHVPRRCGLVTPRHTPIEPVP